ncbi:hypothetical protein F5887DRAFT_1289993 [Amanita rubescens]|nr:hypothetical protein F5887DRAFT_1289993 [Amanita rubescens]
MNDVFSFVNEAKPTKRIVSHGLIVERMSQQVTECAYFIRDYAMNKSLWKRTLKNSFMSDVDGKIKEYEDKFKELKLAFQDRAILQTEIIVSRMFGSLNSLDINLQDMPYAKGARFDPAKKCLPGTRNMMIKEIIQWVNRPNADDVPRIFLLSGVAGSGKSAIAHTIANLFDEQKQLGSSYCFARADQANRRPNNLLSTIALDIADVDQHWKMSLDNIVKGNRSLRTTGSATKQFEKFILEPVMALTTVGPILVVIDALDESAKGQPRKDLLDTLAKHVSDLPSNFRILMTTRPEPDIVSAFKNNRHTLCKYMDTIDEASNKADITLFIEKHLSHVSSLEEKWPNKLWRQMLVESSEGLFQWASTACRAINDPEGMFPETERLSSFTDQLAHGLDALYSEALRQVFHRRDDDAVSHCMSVMGWILATKEPLSISAHSALRGDKLAELILPKLGSFLSGVDQLDIPIRPLHASFFEFLTHQNRSTETYHVDPSQPHRSLTLSSLRVMKSGLRFNIAGLETSHCRNADVPDLAARIEKTIPPHLSYGCRFWADHLGATAYNTEILNGVNMASRMLLSVRQWNQENIDDIASFASDAMKFVAVFGPPISQSAPHVYLSALPFATKNSLVAKQYLRLHPNSKTLCLKTGKADHWPASISVFEGHISYVASVAFSHDSKRIVSGSWDQTIRVWDAETGEVVVGPFKGHDHYITSVAFSHDSKRIISGSLDRTILVWDALETGEVVVGPLKGHTNWVTSVAFSHDSKRIVSGSSDQTILVWDAEAGEVVVGPLKGHTDSGALSTEPPKNLGLRGLRVISSESELITSSKRNGRRLTKT